MGTFGDGEESAAATINKAAGAQVRLGVDVLGVNNHALGEHWTNRDLAAPNQILLVIRLCYILQPLLHLRGGRVKKRDTFALVTHGDMVIVRLLLWLLTYACRDTPRLRNAAQETSKGAKHSRAAALCRLRGSSRSTYRFVVAALGRQRGGGAFLTAEAPPELHATVSAAAAVEGLASATEAEGGSAPPWHPVGGGTFPS